VFVSGELLGHELRDVMASLLHEAPHAIAHERRIQGTSRGRRRHNARYRALVIELGRAVEQAGAIGWSATSMPDETAAAIGASCPRSARPSPQPGSLG